MSTVVDFAMGAYRAMVGRRCTLVATDGRTITGKVLRGIYDFRPGEKGFRLRARSTWYIPLSWAPKLRAAPRAHRRASRR